MKVSDVFFGLSVKSCVASLLPAVLYCGPGVALGAVIDQEQVDRNSSTYTSDAGHATGRLGNGQSFTPSLPLLEAIQVNAVPGGTASANTTVTLNLYLAGGSPSGHAPTGVSLGSATKLLSTLTSSSGGTLPAYDASQAFVFASPISVTPGTQYFFSLAIDDPAGSPTSNYVLFGSRANASDNYAPGSLLVFEAAGPTAGTWAYHDGATNRDLQFRTIGAVPEPASALFLGVAGCALALRRRSMTTR